MRLDQSTIRGRIEDARRSGSIVLDLSGLGLMSLPQELWSLTDLVALHLDGNQLATLPRGIGNLIHLRTLDVGQNQIATLPPEIGNLKRLIELGLDENRLTMLPAEFGSLTQLTTLNLRRNRLTALPPEIGNHTRLVELVLKDNQLTALPPEIGNLTRLTTLDLTRNPLTTLPPSLGGLGNLEYLYLDRHEQWTNPPSAVIAEGTQAIMAFLSGLAEDTTPQWRSKLIVVGQGKSGKTSLLKALAGMPYDPNEPTTHGLRIGELDMPHPHRIGTAMRLGTWDFGGQEIYHATHQFFLTGRSLFIVVWNSRAGYEHGRLPYWLDLIAARAPSASVIVVATHTADRPADLPVTHLMAEYPQIRECVSIDCFPRHGIKELYDIVAHHTADLPLMGQPWPSAWLAAQDASRADPHTHMPLHLYRELLEQAGVTDEQSQNGLLGSLHELGEVLHWADDPELAPTVVLKPQWLSDRVSTILDSPAVAQRQGLLRTGDVDEQWQDIDPDLRRDLLHMMDKYDVSYRIYDHTDPAALAIVVDWLPWDPPAYLSTWDSLVDATQISLRYVFEGAIPPGIPTWFIAREHRFTTAKHRPWRTGALLRHYDGGQFGLIELNQEARILDLTVRGEEPQKFMYLLDDGLQMTFDRYPGLRVNRKVPCQCRPGCDYSFDYERLLRRRRKHSTVECERTDEPIDIELLLRGIPLPASADRGSRDVQILRLLDSIHTSVAGQSELLQREFTGLRNLQSVRCPTVFTLIPAYHVAGVQGYKIRLYCEEPGVWHHLPGDAGCYRVQDLNPWLRKVAPHLNRIAKLLGAALGLAVPVLGMAAGEITARIKDDLSGMKGILELTRLPEAPAMPDRRPEFEADYRAIHQLLTALDPQNVWGGLSRTLTPEGSVLYLCREHAARYRAPSPRPADL